MEKILELHKRALTCLGLSYQGYMWIMDWHDWQMNSNGSGTPFTIHEHELNALGLNQEELLSSLIARDLGNPWVNTTESFDYVTPDKEVATAFPGNNINGTKVLRLHLPPPQPESFPYISFIKVFDSICQQIQLDYHKVLFSHNGILFEDPMRFVLFLRYSGCKISDLLQQLHDWHVKANDYIKQAFVSSIKRPGKNHTSTLSHEEALQQLVDRFYSLRPTDPEISGLFLSRKEMSALLGSATRTIRKWDKLQSAPGGLLWPAPQKDRHGNCIYKVSLYLASMQRLKWEERSAA